MDKDAMKILLEQISKTTSATQSELREMRNEFSDMRVTQGEQKRILDEHMRRTDLNEKLIAKNHEDANKRFDRIDHDMAPLKAHIAMWSGAGKVLVVLGVLAGIAGAAIKVLM